MTSDRDHPARKIVGRTLTRAVTPEQINRQADGGLRRLGSIREIDQSDRTVDIAFSSETPVERWFGDEVLVHTAAAVRMERMNDGAALLMDHDRRDQVGVVEEARIDSDGVGRCKVRFGKGARASEIFQDVIDGIRRQISVGYLVHTIEIEMRDGEPDLVRVTDWEPYEVSFVSVAADPTVGVGRSQDGRDAPEARPRAAGQDDHTSNPAARPPEGRASRKGQHMKTRIMRNEAGQLVRAKVDEDGKIVETLEVLEEPGAETQAARTAAQEEERARVSELRRLGEQYGESELALEMIGDSRTAEDMREALLKRMSERTDATLSRSHDIGMTQQDTQRFSFNRLIRAMAEPSSRAAQEAAKFEMEACEAAARETPGGGKGFVVPTDVLRAPLTPSNSLQRGPVNTSVSGASPGDTGGFSIATDLMAGSFIEMLRNRTVFMRLARTMQGLQGNIEIPGQARGPSGYWVTNEDDAATEDQFDLRQIAMSPKTVAATTQLTRLYILQSSMDAEAFTRDNLAIAMAETIDLAGFYGSGIGGQPKGIVNYTGVNAVDFDDASGADTTDMPTYADVVEMETAIAADNADIGTMAYVMGAAMRGHLKTTEKFSGSNGMPIWEPGNTVNGYSTEVTNQIAAGDLFFGAFNQAIVGMWGGLDLLADPFSRSTRGKLQVTAFQSIDIALRHEQAFSYGTDATST